MASEALARFPVDTAGYSSNFIEPTTVGDQYLYPGDSFVTDSLNDAVWILDTSLGALGDSADIFRVSQNKASRYDNPGLSELVDSHHRYLRCLGYNSCYDEQQDKTYHLYIGRIDDQILQGAFNGNRFLAWWRDASAIQQRLEFQTDMSQNETVATGQSLRELVDKLLPTGDAVTPPTLQTLFAEHQPFSDIITDTLQEAARLGADRLANPPRITAPTIANRSKQTGTGNTSPSLSTTSQSGNNHSRSASPRRPLGKHDRDIPTIQGDAAARRPGFGRIYPGDRYIVRSYGKMVGPLQNADQDQICLKSGELVIVQDVTTEETSTETGRIKLHYWSADSTQSRSLSSVDRLLTAVTEGGRRYRYLARDAYVRVIGPDSPATITVHAFLEETYDGQSETPDRLWKAAYAKHETDLPMLEHPLSLHQASFESQTELVDALATPETSFSELPGELNRWAEDSDVADLCTRVSRAVSDTAAEREFE